MSDPYVIIGSAGTGKTTKLIDIYQNETEERGIEKVYFLTFSKTTRREIEKRLGKKFTKAELENVRTLHSLCFNLLGLKPEEVVKTKHIKRFFLEMYGLDYKNSNELDINEPVSILFGDDEAEKIFRTIQKSRQIITSVNNTREIEEVSVTYRQQVKNIAEEYIKYKKENNIYDFDDMIEKVPELNLFPHNLEVLIVDEFQDLTPLQYITYKHLATYAKKVIIAGDDDQAIYGFSGSDHKMLIKEYYKATENGNAEVLNTCYRSGANIMKIALNFIEKNCKDRIPKEINFIDDSGEFEMRNFYGYGDIVNIINNSYENNKIFILARTNAECRRFSEILNENLIPHSFIKRGSIWTNKFINLINSFIRTKKKKAINKEQILVLMDYIPSSSSHKKFGFKRGTKKQVKKNQKEIYTNTEFLDLLTQKIPLFLVIDGIHNKKLSENKKDILKRCLQLNKEIENREIAIGTYHSSKGLETYINIVYNNLPRRLFEKFDNEVREEEARNLFTAMTRGKIKTIVMNGVRSFPIQK